MSLSVEVLWKMSDVELLAAYIGRPAGDKDTGIDDPDNHQPRGAAATSNVTFAARTRTTTSQRTGSVSRRTRMDTWRCCHRPPSHLHSSRPAAPQAAHLC